MKRRHFYSTPFLLFLFIFSFSKLHVLQADAASELADLTTTRAFLKQVDSQRSTDPTGALQAVQQYQAQHADMNPARISDLDLEIAAIYYENLKDTDKALTALDAGIARSKIPRVCLPLITQKCNILSQTQSKEKAIAYFKENVPRYMEDRDLVYLMKALPTYNYWVNASGKTEDILFVLHQVLATHPDQVENGRICTWLIRNLLKEPGHADEALGYAKLYWMTCKFDEKSINTATSLLQKIWISKNLNAAQGNAFLKAMQDSSAPNPLQKIETASLDAVAVENKLKTLRDQADHKRITLLLIQGKNGDAMLAARRQLLDNPTSGANQGAIEIARVFKATDLNLVRANAFLQYFKTGQGANPLDDFFKEHPSKTSTSATTN